MKQVQWHKRDVNQRMKNVRPFEFEKTVELFRNQYEDFRSKPMQKTFFATFASNTIAKRKLTKTGMDESKDIGASNVAANNPLKLLLFELQDKQVFKKKQALFSWFDEQIPAKNILDFAEAEFGLIRQFYSVIDGNSIEDNRVINRRFKNCEFLHDTCNISYKEIEGYCDNVLVSDKGYKEPSMSCENRM